MKRPIVRRYLISYNLVLLQFAEDTHPCLYYLTIPQTPHFLKAKPESFFHPNCHTPKCNVSKACGKDCIKTEIL